jgi:hypothetical protein
MKTDQHVGNDRLGEPRFGSNGPAREAPINGKEVLLTKLWFGGEDYIEDLHASPEELFR